eukprot:3107044-Amphidinium_carterae.1
MDGGPSANEDDCHVTLHLNADAPLSPRLSTRYAPTASNSLHTPGLVAASGPLRDVTRQSH